MKPYKTDCFYYTEVHDMGACISQCKRYRQLGKCPCDNCTDYISNKETSLVIQEYVRNKNGRTICGMPSVTPSGIPHPKVKTRDCENIKCSFYKICYKKENQCENFIKGKPHWLKLTPNQKRSTYFICSRCMERCVCINLDKNKVNRCNYKFCPWCGEEMEVEDDDMVKGNK